MIRVACPTCSEVREFAAHLAGWEVRCFWCQNPIPIPVLSGDPVDPPTGIPVARSAPRRRPPVARRVAEAARSATRRAAETRPQSAEPAPTPPVRRRRKRMSSGEWVGVLMAGVILAGVATAALLG